MEELIRTLRLNQLLNIPLTGELEDLNSRVTFIQKDLDKLVLKVDDVNYHGWKFYFIDKVCLLQYKQERRSIYCQHKWHESILKIDNDVIYSYLFETLLREYLNIETSLALTVQDFLWFDSHGINFHFRSKGLI